MLYLMLNLKNTYMKTKTIKTLVACIAAATILVTGCKKGDTGPAGKNGANGIVPASTDGFIKGTVIGTRKDGTTFNSSFNFQNYWSGHSGTLDSTSAFSSVFTLQRGADIFGTNVASIQISTASPTATTGFLSMSGFSFTESLGTNKEFDFSLTGNASANVTGLSYNRSSGLFTGSFTINVSGANNTTGNTATIAGSFQCTITQLYYFVKHTSPNQAVKG